jgi:hypothetical protein
VELFDADREQLHDFAGEIFVGVGMAPFPLPHVRVRLGVQEGQVFGNVRVERRFLQDVAVVSEGVPHENVVKGLEEGRKE